MIDFICLEDRFVPLEWDDTVSTVLPLPGDVAKARAAAERARRAKGEIDHITPDDVIDVKLRHADPQLVEVTSDVTNAIRSAGAHDALAALTPGRLRGLLHQITTANGANTRPKRISKLLTDLTT